MRQILGDQHLLARIVEGENALVDVDDGVDERDFGVQARLADEVAHRLAEAQHQRLLGRIDGEERVAGDDDRHDNGDQYPQAVERVPHFGAPAGFSGDGSSAR
jgi:hypothetical protein